MKYTLIIEDHTYEVEIENLHTRPIIARVNGEVVEVWTGMKPAVTISTPEKTAAVRPASKISAKETGQAEDKVDVGHTEIRSPIPGTITNISVKVGDKVTAGQELCVLEAMKMKNQIRATRPGIIAAIRVTPGQTVQHRDILMEYAE